MTYIVAMGEEALHKTPFSGSDQNDQHGMNQYSAAQTDAAQTDAEQHVDDTTQHRNYAQQLGNRAQQHVEEQSANVSQHPKSLIGRESNVVPGHFGDPITVEHALFSHDNGNALPGRPMFLCLHGWGSNEEDLADIMQYIAPFNDYVSLRAPLTLQAPEGNRPGAYTWFHDSVPSGDDLDCDAFAAASAIDQWVDEHLPIDRDIVPIGFSQGGTLAIHLLRIHPERYRAAINLSGCIAPGNVLGTAPADDRIADFDIPVYYGYGKNDTVIPKYELFATAAWLEEHTWLTTKSYHGLDHAVNIEEFTDLNQWMLVHNITSGVL